MDSADLFSQSPGYIGKTTYTLKYLENTRDFSYKWPRSSVLHENNYDSLLNSILKQDVGIDRSFAYREMCGNLQPLMMQFLKRHNGTNYRKLLSRCMCNIKGKYQQSTPRKIVKEFVHRIIFNIIPLPVFGNKINAIQFERNFRKIFFLGKYQVFSLNMVLKNIKVKSLSYLRSIEGFNNRMNFFAKLFVWLIRMYILTALKCVFYVSESNHGNKYVYYEKYVWKKIQHRRVKKIKKEVLGLYKNCLVTGVIQSQHLYTLKLLPKRRGSRPIFVKLEVDHSWKSKCNLARKTAEVLLARIAEKYFENVHSSWSVFHKKWLSMRDKWISNSKSVVYFVRTDFVDAFANIDLTKLTEIISKIRMENQSLSDLRFQFSGWLKIVPLSSAFRILENYACKFYFKHCEKIYRLSGGLCQGGPLSCQLYNLYLGEWEQLYLNEFVKDDMGFFIRNCDDCLYITMDYKKASSYLRLLEEGFPEFNLQVNLQKTETNIRDESKVTVSFGSYLLDVRSFEIKGCYEFCRDLGFFHSSRLSSVESPGKIISKRISRPCMLKLTKVFLDTTYNSIHTILYNVFMASYVTAAKCLVFIERLFVHFNNRFIMTCLKTGARCISRAVFNLLTPEDGIVEDMLQWMVIKAFHVRLLAIKANKFENIVLHVYNILKSLLHRMNEAQREIISAFFAIKQPDPFKSLV